MYWVHFNNRTRNFYLLVLLLVGICGLYPSIVQAHAKYERSDPPADAVIPQAPTEVHVWFSQELFRRQGANTVEVYGPDGTRVDLGDARIDDDDRTHMIVSLPPGLPAGTYTVRWQTLSAEDGDDASGEFVFTIAEPGETPMPATEPAEATAIPSPTAAPTDTPAPPTPVPTPPPPQASPTPTSAAGGSLLPCLSGFLVGGLALIGLLGRRTS